MAERVTKYFEDTLRHKDARIDRLRLGIAALSAAARKEELEAANARGPGADGGAEGGAGKKSSDVLAYIDFHQLQIENKQSSAKMDDKNAELMRLKVTTGSAITTLNSLKTKLSSAIRDMGRLRSVMRGRAAVIIKLNDENTAVERDVAAAEGTRDALAATAAEGGAHMPTTIDYVVLTAMEKDLQAEVASWSRKLEIATLSARTASARLRMMGTASGPGTSTTRSSTMTTRSGDAQSRAKRVAGFSGEATQRQRIGPGRAVGTLITGSTITRRVDVAR